ADFYNPASQMIVRLTQPVLAPIRRIVPPMGSMDLASLIFFILLITIKNIIFASLLGVPFSGHLLITILKNIGSLIINFFIVVIIIQVIASWIAPSNYNPYLAFLNQLSEPILMPIRRILPPLGGLDFSALVALILLNFLQTLLGL
ncbi:MAG: YggT family protein, partial [Pseudomonadota bacterium]